MTVIFEDDVNDERNFSIFTNVPENEWRSCVLNWEARNSSNLTPKSLVDYINSKTGRIAELTESL